MGPQAHFENRSKCGVCRIAASGWTPTSAEDDRHGPVIHELDGHPGPEDASGHIDSLSAEGLTEAVAAQFGLLRRRGPGEARPIPLLCVPSTSDVNRKMEEP